MGLLKRLTTNATLKQKLTAIIMLISLIVLLLASGSFVLSKVASYRQETLNRLATITGILGTNLETAVTLRHKHVVTQLLSSLENEPEISAAYVFSKDGTPLAHFFKDGPGKRTAKRILDISREDVLWTLESGRSRHAFSHGKLVYHAPINGDSGTEGVISLQVNLASLYQFIYRFIASTVAVFLLLALIAFLLTSRMQEIISRPIRDLAKTVDRVTTSNDFSIRANLLTTKDEVGDLVNGFNSMLEQIQARDNQLEEYRQNLEELVLQRTRELTQTNSELQQAIRELKSAKRVAEEASQAKSQFLAKMSHEIRTPMIGIMGMAEQLTEAPLPESERGLALTVQKSGETLLGILDDVLDFSRIEAGRMELEEIRFSLRDLCRDAISIFSRQAAEKGLRLSCHIDDNCSGRFLGDPLRIKQILINLVSNAVKFTAAGEVVLTASCTGASSERTVWLAVTDTGIGIPGEAQDEIFESFSQADNTMTRKFGGSGLGLAIVRQLTHLMGGTCGLQSTPGKGSTFWVVLDLPVAGDDTDSVPVAEPLSGEQTAAMTASRRPRILLVEDNLTTQQLLRLILDKADCDLDIRENGRLAIETLRDNSYDLIFMDCEMPGMDGFETTRTLREEECRTPIIALTAHVRKEDISSCFEAGMNDYLSKPFRQKQLLDIISKWLPQETRSVG